MGILGSPSLLLSVQQYQEAYDQAIAMFSVFEDEDASELLRMRADLAAKCERFRSTAGLEWEHCGNLARHLSFLEHFLIRENKAACEHDVRDILFHDLPTALKSLISHASDPAHIDQRLRDAVLPLIEGGHYDSAVRKTFVVLTDRLRRAFAVEDKLDGEDLINAVFGKGGKIPVAADPAKKQALRNLLSGFYGIYRNRFAHNDIEPTLSDVGAIVETANSILLEVEALSSESTKNAP